MQEIDRSSLTCGNQRSSSSLEEIVPKSEAKEEEELPRKKKIKEGRRVSKNVQQKKTRQIMGRFFSKHACLDD